MIFQGVFGLKQRQGQMAIASKILQEEDDDDDDDGYDDGYEDDLYL